MEGNWKESNQQKHQFKSYYCANCRQRKPCGALTGWSSEWRIYCCLCFYQSEQAQAQEYSNYQQVYQRKEKEKKDHIQHYNF